MQVDDFVFARAGPYQTADEVFLTKYWDCIDTGIGRTFKVSNSTGKHTFSDLLEDVYFPKDLEHYVIATGDLCLKEWAEKPLISE